MGALPHLDRAFEYAIPADMDELAPGQRVRVAFAGRDSEALVRERVAAPDTDRPLAPIRKLVSTDRVISEDTFRVCAMVAERTAGSLTDVLRLAVPARHARAEKRAHADREEFLTRRAESADADDAAEPVGFLTSRYRGLAAFYSHAREGGSPRAAITLDPAESWLDAAVEAVRSLDDDQGALILAPDARDAARVSAALQADGISCAQLTSSEGPEKRYRTFLRILSGEHRVVVGTRSAAFAPVANLGLILMWDEADDLFEEPRAPYPHARTVVLARSHIERVPVLFLTPSRSVQLTQWARDGVLVELEPAPAPHALTHPRIELMDEHLREREGASGYSRLPQRAYRLIREGLTRGPVLVQVPRSGYVPALVCTFCGTRATCTACHAALVVRGRGQALVCPVCGLTHGAFRCAECDRTQVRPVVSGSARTADDLKRAFGDVEFHVSGGAGGIVPDEDVDGPCVVVATPGAEPLPAGGYAACAVLDADGTLARAAFDADVEAVRRWSHAIAATRPFSDGGQVLVVGTAHAPAIRSLVVPRGRAFIDTVLEQRAELLFPPLSKVVEARGDKAAVAGFLDVLELPGMAGVLGPLDDVWDGEKPVTRAVLRIAAPGAQQLVEAVRAALMVRSAKKLPGQLRVQVDPPHIF